MLSESYLVDEMDLCCLTVTRWGRRVVGVGKAARSVPGTEGSRKVSHRGWVLGGRRRRWGRRESLGCKNSGRTGGAAVRPKVDTMVWSKSFGVSDMRDKQGVPCNLPEALLRNPNCWPLGTRTSRDGCPVQSTRRRGPRHQVPVGDQIEHLVKPASQRCCDAGLQLQLRGCGGGVAAATGSQISNLKSQSSQANSHRLCV